MKLLTKYFPNLTSKQLNQYVLLAELFKEYNANVNMISRKDIENLEERHILHSLAIAKFISFKPKTTLLDLGTGGGFPGLPLAILFPECKFHLVDSIGKKVNVVKALVEHLELNNVEALHARAESLSLNVDFVISRAVAPISDLYRWSKNNLTNDKYNDKPNGFILLKGGNLTAEKNDFKTSFAKAGKLHEIHLDHYFREAYFETKKIIYFSK